MKSQEIQKHIDRAVGTEGTLRIPSWWMHKILSDLVLYCEENKGGDTSELKSYVDSQIKVLSSLIDGIDGRVEELESHEMFAIVGELPTEPKDNTIYLVPSPNGEDHNVLTEWVHINGSWEQFGEFKVDVDLSEYAKKEDIHTPDWNAAEGEEGHIKNRTHYADFVEVDIPEDIASSEAEVTIPYIAGVPILVHYRGYVTSKYLKISPDDHELHVFSYGPAFKIRRGSGNNIFISGHNNENHRLYIATHFVALNEIFLPDTIARTEEIPTKLSQLEKDIEIGSSYDDTQIKEDIVLRNVAAEDTDEEVEEPNVPSGSYDDTELREMISELEKEVESKQNQLVEGDGISIEGNVISCIHDKTLYKVVTELPATGEEHKIYLIVSTEQEENNVYNEYAYINGAWEMLGTYKATIDLEPYAKKDEIATINGQSLVGEGDIAILGMYDYYKSIGGGASESAFKTMMKYLFTPFMVSSTGTTNIPDELLNAGKTNFFTDYYWHYMRLTGGEPFKTTEWKDGVPYRFMGMLSGKYYIIDFATKTIKPA